MRLFTGLALPPAAAAPLLALRPLADLRWTPEAKLHVTTKFIGEWPDDRLGELQSALAALHANPVPISIGGLAWMSGVLMATVEPTPPLTALVAATEATLEPLGIAKERSAYLPHVTLARARIAKTSLALDKFPRFTATSFHLYLSASGKYTSLKEFPLTAE